MLLGYKNQSFWIQHETMDFTINFFLLARRSASSSRLSSAKPAKRVPGIPPLPCPVVQYTGISSGLLLLPWRRWLYLSWDLHLVRCPIFSIKLAISYGISWNPTSISDFHFSPIPGLRLHSGCVEVVKNSGLRGTLTHWLRIPVTYTSSQPRIAEGPEGQLRFKLAE